MDYVFLALGTMLILIGFAGSILPGLPGPPLSYLGLILLHCTRFVQFSNGTLIGWALAVAVVAILDYVVPVWGTKQFGGTKAGVRGSTVGLIIGIILLPMLGVVIGPFGIVGILGGPFLGAWVGELSAGTDSQQALRAAIGSFIGFLAGTLMKLTVCVILGFIYFRALWIAVF